MTALDCLNSILNSNHSYQLYVNTFIDDFRRADDMTRRRLVEDPIVTVGRMEGLISAVVSALCREYGIESPRWVEYIYSPTPFFAFPAGSFALRVRLMLESPAPFRIRNVFVPENYMNRA